MVFGSFEARLPEAPPGRTTTADLGSVFVQGFLCNVLNPKVAVFFLAFLPQLIDADAPSKVLAFVMLGLMLDVAGTAWNLGVAWVAGRVGALSRLGRFRSWLERLIGALFVAIGVRLALADRP
jgi:threonine/homoserine/homoserine lactone efflux protein